MDKITGFLPVIAFFIAYKFYGIYVASGTIAIISILGLASTYIKTKTISKSAILNVVIISLLSLLTITLQNPVFIKMKPTIIYSSIGVFLIVDILLLKKFYVKKLYNPFVEQNLIEDKENIWRNLSAQWSVALLSVGVLNEFIWRSMSEEIWVNFKVFGMPLIITLIFAAHIIFFSINSKKNSEQGD